MKIQKYSQATFLVENNLGTRILIDPGKYNFSDRFSAADFKDVDILIITHKHADHYFLEAIKSIVQSSSPKIITNPEIVKFLQSEMIEARTVNAGDILEFENLTITIIKTDHAVRGEMIENFGILIEADGKKFYHTSDTRMIDISQLPEEVKNPDVLAVPISNRGVVMGIDDALYFTNQVAPEIVIPMHYDSPKDKARVKPEFFVQRKSVLDDIVENLASVKVQVLGFGEELEL